MSGSQARGNEARRKILQLVRMRNDYKHDAKPPTYREISEAIGLSLATVHRHVKVLIDLGHLERDPGVARSVRLPYDDRGRLGTNAAAATGQTRRRAVLPPDG